MFRGQMSRKRKIPLDKNPVSDFGRCLRDSFAKQMEEKENDDNP